MDDDRQRFGAFGLSQDRNLPLESIDNLLFVFDDPTFDTAKEENWTIEYQPQIVDNELKFDGTRVLDTRYFELKIGETQMTYEF